MTIEKTSGQKPFEFVYRRDLRSLPKEALPFEVDLHGGFACDLRPGHGQFYYGMPGCGIMRLEPDLQSQSIISLPEKLKPLNFHSTKIGEFDGKQRLFMPANNDELVAVLSLDGTLDFVLSRPEFEQYADVAAPYKPTDTILVEDQLLIADGYGSNYISSLDVKSRQWTDIFGGKTENAEEDGKFATAHGINFNPSHHHLDIADRPSSRIQNHHLDGSFLASHKLPKGSFPCGINYIRYQGRLLAVIGSLRDPQVGRPAPIYIIDAESYELLSTIRPKDELDVELAQHMHNVIFHLQGDTLFLVCQAWNPGYYFVLQKV